MTPTAPAATRERVDEYPPEVIVDDLEERSRAAAVADVDLETAEYDELQRVAILLGIRANRKPGDLVDAIRDCRDDLEVIEP